MLRDPPADGEGRVTQYLAVIERDGEAWGAYVPDLPGCVAVAPVPRGGREADRRGRLSAYRRDA
jgi:hypothetical protein